VNISNKREETTLMSRYLTDANVKELIIHDATINAVDLNEESALHLAFK
jgi:ankyrin repeat protein